MIDLIGIELLRTDHNIGLFNGFALGYTEIVNLVRLLVAVGRCSFHQCVAARTHVHLVHAARGFDLIKLAADLTFLCNFIQTDLCTRQEGCTILSKLADIHSIVRLQTENADTTLIRSVTELKRSTLCNAARYECT